MTAPAWSTYDILEWGEIPGTYQVGTAADVTSNYSDCSVRMSYSGMTIIGAVCALVANGGHTDYTGNEVVAIDLSADAPDWVLWHAQSTSITDNAAYGPDGLPSSAHRYYGGFGFSATHSAYQLHTSFTGSTGQSFAASNRFDTSSKTWDAAGTIADAPGLVETLDTSTGNLWGHGTNLYYYDPTANAFTTITPSGDITGGPLVYDPTTDDFKVFCWTDNQGDPGSGTVFFRLSKSGVRTNMTVNSSAAYTAWQALQAYSHSVIKDPNNNRWFVFSPLGAANLHSKDIYTLTESGTADVYDMAVLSVTGVALPDCDGSGSFNRFQYVSALNGIVYMPKATQNMLFLRLSGTPAPGRSSFDSHLKLLVPMQGSTAVDVVSGATIVKNGTPTYDSSLGGWTFGTTSGDALTVASWPYASPPFTFGVMMLQPTGTGVSNNAGLGGVEIGSDGDNQQYTMFLDTLHQNNVRAHTGSDYEDAINGKVGFTEDKWMLYAGVFNADGTHYAYDSGSGMVENSNPISITGSPATLYMGSYARGDFLFNNGQTLAYFFFFDNAQTKAQLDQIAADPTSLLIAATPPVTGTVAATLGGMTVAVTARDPDASSASMTLGGITVAVTAADPVHAAAAATLGAITVAVTARDPDATSAAMTLGGLTVASAATNSTHATIAPTLGGITVSVAAADPDSSGASMSLGGLSVNVVATQIGSSFVAMTLGGITVAAVAVDPDASSAGMILGAMSVASTAAVGVSAEGGMFLGGFTVAVTATAADAGVAAGTVAMALGGITVAAVAADPEATSIGITLGGISVSVVAVDPDATSVGIALGGLTVTATALVGDAIVSMSLGAMGVDIEASLSGDAMLLPTLSEIMPALLNALVDGRVWQDNTPDDLPRDPTTQQLLPFILWSRFGGIDSEYLGQSPAPKFSNARVQIHTVGPHAIATELLCNRVRDALLASTYTVGVYGSPVGTYDAARKLRVQRQQFSIWFRQSA